MTDNPQQQRLDAFREGVVKRQETLKSMGYTSLRQGQETPINSLMLQKDTICILPTGMGKSLVFALTTKCMGWKTLVFSPLIALMRDQVQSMNDKGIVSACVNSSQTDIINYGVWQQWARGEIEMLYIAPEQLKRPECRLALQSTKPQMIIMDEAHTISQWSKDFRPAFRAVGDAVRDFDPKVVGAFTATATPNVIDDIKEVLKMTCPTIHKYYPRRDNLKLSSSRVDDADLFDAIAHKLTHELPEGGAAIVYFSTVKQLNDAYSYLNKLQLPVTRYCGEMRPAEKSINQDDFMNDRMPIMLATNAFGMGVDKPNIRMVIHAGMPGSIEAVAQETGRAARDGKDAVCHMFVTNYGAFIQEFFWANSNPASDELQKIYSFLRERADGEGKVYMTGTEIKEATGVDGPDACLQHLMSLGCIKRDKPEHRIFTVVKLPIQDATYAGLAKARKTTYDLIEPYGVEDNTYDGPGKCYKVDFDAFAAARIERGGVSTPESVRAHLTQMSKENIISYTAPFSGKVTTLVRPPDAQELKNADISRIDNREDFIRVRQYAATPDESKHAFLEKFFAL